MKQRSSNKQTALLGRFAKRVLNLLQTLLSSSSVTLFTDRQLDTLTLWQRDVRLTSFTNDENVV